MNTNTYDVEGVVKMSSEIEALRKTNSRYLDLLRRIYNFLKHAPEFPMDLLTDAEMFQEEIRKEIEA